MVLKFTPAAREPRFMAESSAEAAAVRLWQWTGAVFTPAKADDGDDYAWSLTDPRNSGAWLRIPTGLCLVGRRPERAVWHIVYCIGTHGEAVHGTYSRAELDRAAAVLRHYVKTGRWVAM